MKKLIMITHLFVIVFSVSLIGKNFNLNKLDLPYDSINSNLATGNGKIYFFDIKKGLIEFDFETKIGKSLLNRKFESTITYRNSAGNQQTKTFEEININGKYAMFLSMNPDKDKIAICMSVANSDYTSLPKTIYVFDIINHHLEQVIEHETTIDLLALGEWPNSEWIYSECLWISQNKIAFIRNRVSGKGGELGQVDLLSGTINIFDTEKYGRAYEGLAELKGTNKISLTLKTSKNEYKNAIFDISNERVEKLLNIPYSNLWIKNNKKAILRGTIIREFDIQTKRLTDVYNIKGDIRFKKDKEFNFFSIDNKERIFGLTDNGEVYQLEIDDGE